MINVVLHGILADTFGSTPVPVNGKDMRDIMSLLISRFGVKFRNMIEAGQWHVIKGKKKGNKVSKKDNFISEETLPFPILDEEVHFFPAITGAGGKGVGQIILGIVLIIVAIVVAVYTGGAALAAEGAVAGGAAGGATAAGAGATLAAGFAASSIASSLLVAGIMAVAGGVMAMLTKSPNMNDYGSASSADSRPSFLFNGVVNNTEQGVPVPLVYGRHLTGSTVIYAGMDVEQL